MIPDKQIKKKFKLEASKNPEKYYPTKYNGKAFTKAELGCT